jgi:hypothetical protein
MLSVIIPTRNSERDLVRTLAALVPGAMDGLIREVLVADRGSVDDTAIVADVAGCEFIADGARDAGVAAGLTAAAARARAPWLLFLRPGTILAAGWPDEARRFIEPSGERVAAVFRRGAAAQPALREALALLAGAFGVRARPKPEQGLLIAKSHYDALGGHSARSADPEAELLRRIGRRHLVTLTTAALHAR